MAFDGSHVTLERLTAPFREATVVVDGPVNRVLDDTSFDLTLEGTLDMAPLVAWAPPPVPVSGAGTFNGTHDRPARPATRSAWRSGRRRWSSPVPTPAARRRRLDHLGASAGRAVPPGRARRRPGGRSAGHDRGPRAVHLRRRRPIELRGGVPRSRSRPGARRLRPGAADVAAWEDGTVDADARRSGRATADSRRGRSSPLARRDRIALDGTLGRGAAGRALGRRHDHQLLDTVRASGTAHWPDVVAPAPAPLTGPLVVEVGDVGRAVRAARQSGIDVSAALEDVGGPVQASFELGGTLGSRVLRGRVESTAMTLPDRRVRRRPPPTSCSTSTPPTSPPFDAHRAGACT